MRTQVKTYAEEQAEDVVKPAWKRKRTSDPDDEEAETKKPAKKTRKAVKSNDTDENASASTPTKKASKASSSKPARTATNRSCREANRRQQSQHQ
jgi:hypothetical protein